MPISENELMWARSLPEEVEADASEAVAISDPKLPAAEQPQAAPADVVADPDPVVRMEETSRLEATLARLEMNSIEIKMHLDSLEQRISRMEPHLEGRSRSAWEAEKVPDSEISEEQPLPVREEAAEAEKVAPAESVQVREAKEDRWSHLMGSDLDSPVAAPFGTMAAPAGAHVNETPAPALTAAEPPALVGRAPGESAVRPFAEPTARPAEARASAELPAHQRVQPGVQPAQEFEQPSRWPTQVSEKRTDRWNATPVSNDRYKSDEIRSDEIQTASDHPQPGPLRPFPVRRATQRDPRLTADERPGEQLPAPRMFSTLTQASISEDVPTGGPKTWRGYRVSRLVFAVVLLLLAALPLVIWWRLSVDARDADAGDAMPASRAVPSGVVPFPGVKPSAGQIASARVRPAPLRNWSQVGGETESSSQLPASRRQGNRAGQDAGTGRNWLPSGDPAPVVRRSPLTSGSSAYSNSSLPNRPGAAGARNLTASVGGTGAGSRGQIGDADTIQGRSGMRVRVPERVMAEHLLPVGDVGELPRGSGEVVAAVYVSNTGRVEDVQVISGAGGLRDAAARAIRNWRYEPYVQSGVRVPVVTTASIRFNGGSGEAQ